jgi:Flp pilus assembly protein TadG
MRQSSDLKSHRPIKGAAIIESCLILLAFLLLLLGIMEAGRLMNFQQILTDAAREGARYAVAPTAGTSTLPTDTEIQTMVQTFLDSGGVKSASISIQRPVDILTGSITTQFTRVTVTASYQPITSAMFFSSTLSLKGEALMRNETSP